MNYTPHCNFERADHLAKPHYPDGAWQCVKCGRVSPFGGSAFCSVKGWADRLEQITRKIGLKKCGGCTKRQTKWNKWEAQIKDFFRGKR